MIILGLGYCLCYDCVSEQVWLGYYWVYFIDYDIFVEFIVIVCIGLYCYIFYGVGVGYLLVDFVYGFYDGDELVKVFDVLLWVVGNDILVGSCYVYQWVNGWQIYFVMKFLCLFVYVMLYCEDVVLDEVSEVCGDYLKVVLYIDDIVSVLLLVKVGLLGVDIDGVLCNLEVELLGWNFDVICDVVLVEWEYELGCIYIDIGFDVMWCIFYIVFYYIMLVFMLFSDVDGCYCGMDLVVYMLLLGLYNYSIYLLWDIYCVLYFLFILVQFECVFDFVNGLICMVVESLDGLLVWLL